MRLVKRALSLALVIFMMAEGMSDVKVSAYDLIKEGKVETKVGNDFTGEVGKSFKTVGNNNPLSSEVFCADPTAVEYNGRLYVYGTNDHEQCNKKGIDEDNTYERIKSMIVFSTDDMVNWIYHGEINVGEVAPWIINSWAPSIVSRKEDDGKTHFYMYFSNNGAGVGVIHATNPLGPWDDPLGEPLVSSDTEGLNNCPNPFDPGVVIDDKGDAYLSFGGGNEAKESNNYIPGSSKIVKLGDDMVSFDSKIADIPAPYFFEASELNYINGTYVYTYCSDWKNHAENWNYDTKAPGQCSMIYMTSTNPLDSSSWVMKGECLKNPGDSGFEYSNNHTHLHKYKGKWYMLYHTLALKGAMGIKGGYRSISVEDIDVDEENVVIEDIGGTKVGNEANGELLATEAHLLSELNTTADISYEHKTKEEPVIVSDKAGAYVCVKGVRFTESAPKEEGNVAVETEEKFNSITYNFNVKSVDKNTTITMYPNADDSDYPGSVQVKGTGEYSITCDLGGANGMANMGYFRASDDAKVTMVLENFVINGKYVFEVNSELTNTREWADGLRNIWGGFSDGDSVYEESACKIIYDSTSNSLKFIIKPVSDNVDEGLTKLDNLAFLASVSGKGRVEVRLDNPKGQVLTAIDFEEEEEYVTVYSKEVEVVGGKRDLYFVFSDKNIKVKYWQFADRDNFGEEIKYVRKSTDSSDKADEGKKDNNESAVDKSEKDNEKILLKRVVIKKAKSIRRRTISLKWKRVKKAKGYQIILATNKKFTKNKRKITIRSGKKTKKVIKKLKSKRVYYVKIRAFVKTDKGRKYGKFSKRKKVLVK